MFNKKLCSGKGWWLIPEPQIKGQVDLNELQASLVYRACYKSGRNTGRNPFQNNKEKTYFVSNAREQVQNILDLLSSENKSNPICY